MPFTPLAKEQTEAEAGEGARIPDQGPAGAVPGELPLAEVARIFQGSVRKQGKEQAAHRRGKCSSQRHYGR